MYTGDEISGFHVGKYRDAEVLTAFITRKGPDDGGSKHLRNVGKLPEYIAQQPKDIHLH
jgi:hypothetical protein